MKILQFVSKTGTERLDKKMGIRNGVGRKTEKERKEEVPKGEKDGRKRNVVKIGFSFLNLFSSGKASCALTKVLLGMPASNFRVHRFEFQLCFQFYLPVYA